MKETDGKLGLLSSVCILVGGCIGSAIYSLSGMTMYYAGASSILSWIIAALIQGSYGIQVAELSVRYPRSGGVYIFPSRALSPFWGFIASWGYVVTNFVAVAFAAIYIGTYLSVSFAIFQNYRTLLAIVAIIITALLNSLKISRTGKFNVALVFFLLITMITFAVVSFTNDNFNISNFTPFFNGAKGKFGFLSAIPNAMVGYGSVVSIAFMVENIKNPNKTVPRSMAISMLIVMAIYIMIIVATLGHVTISYLIENPGMRFIPLFAAVWTSMTSSLWLSKLISISAFFALITTMLVVQYLNALAIKAMASDNKLPKLLSRVNKNDAPIYAIILSALISSLLSLKPSLTEFLVNLASLIACITIVIVISSLIKSRRTTPHIDGAYKAFGGNALSILTICVIVICYIPSIISGNLYMWGFTALVYLIGIIVYKIYEKRTA